MHQYFTAAAEAINSLFSSVHVYFFGGIQTGKSPFPPTSPAESFSGVCKL
jgi:hypothetical protein